ncbi:hypothetical protein ABI214_08085 [Prescottella soli]|uniref:MFS transporter n=1 Tax=Prescottella soli TaxID=1543852 RepID=A0ABW9FRD4_9NOCA
MFSLALTVFVAANIAASLSTSLAMLMIPRVVAAGVPIGTWIGGHLGWRKTFIAVAVAGTAPLVTAAPIHRMRSSP